MNEYNLTPEEIHSIADSMAHKVDPNRLAALTEGVNQLNSKLAKLNTLDLSDCERAETLDFLNLNLEDFPEP